MASRRTQGLRFAPAAVQVLENRQLLSGILIVTTTSDAVSHSGVSLRDAIATANADGSGDTIQFDPSLNGTTITLTQGELLITGSVTISGSAGGASGITISGGNTSRIFDLKNATTNTKAVTISDLTLTGGNAVGLNSSGAGGAIVNFSKLSLFGVTFTANTATIAGGAVDNRSSMAATDCTFVGNKVTGTNGAGGAISNRYATITTLTNDTIIENSVTGKGSTGGGIGANYPNTSTVAINTLILGNTAVASNNDFSGTLSGSSQNNLIGIPLGKTLSDIVQTSGGAPLLASNGGPTQTVALIGSVNNPAFDVGTNPLTTLGAAVPTAVSGASTTIKVASAQYLQLADLLQIDSEIVAVTAISGTNLTVVRGVLGTTPSAHTSGTGLMVTDQRGQLRHTNKPDLGAFETQSTTLSLTAPGGTYTSDSIGVTGATVTSGLQTVATFGSPYLSYTYYAGTLSAGDILTATPLAGAPRNAGNYTVVGSYNNAPGYRPSASDPVHFTIIPAPLSVAPPISVGGGTVSAVGAIKVYDGTTASTQQPVFSGLLGTDTGTGTEAYVSKNVLGANNSVLYVLSYTINDGNGGNNYTMDASGTAVGTITPAPLTISAVTDSKTYDSTTSSVGVPTISGLVGTDTAVATQAFQSPDVLGPNNSVLYVDSFAISDDNGGNNYSVNSSGTAAGTISAATLTISAVSDLKVYDATTSSSATPTVTGLLGSDSATAVQAFQSKNVLGADGSLLYIENYTINGIVNNPDYIVTLETATGTITPADLTITAVTETRDYDGTTNSGLTPTYSGLLGTDSISDLSQAYYSRNVHPAGQNPLYALTWTISDDNGGLNYSVITPATPGTILAIPLTISATSGTKAYDGTIASTAVPTVVGLVGTDTVTQAKEHYTSALPMGVDGSTLFVSSYALNDGSGGGNYIVTLNTAPGTIYYAASKLAFETPLPTSGTAGQALSPTVKVDVKDAYGNLVTDDNSSTVTITLNTGVFAGGDNFVTAPVVNGVATFSGPSALVINKAATGYILTASSGVLTSAQTPKFSITAATGSQLEIQTAPSSVTAGANFSVSISVKDAFGNPASTPSPVSLTLNTGTFSGTFAGKSTATATNSAGTATFSSTLQLTTAGAYTLTASAAGIVGTPSFNLTVNPAAASKLIFLTQPTTGAMNSPLGQIQVAVADTYGNTITSDNTSIVTLAIFSGPSGGTLSGTVSVQVVNGVATFNNLILNKVGTYVLRATTTIGLSTFNRDSASILIGLGG
ncbi:MAG: hypothetical protein JSS02_24340 [Planctomycetes bacterium]|nr:hypothetical protein [Planctomycetota bacterium]